MRSCYGKLVKNWENVQGIASTIQTRRLELCSISEFVKSQIMFVLFPAPRAVVTNTEKNSSRPFSKRLGQRLQFFVNMWKRSVQRLGLADWVKVCSPRVKKIAWAITLCWQGTFCFAKYDTGFTHQYEYILMIISFWHEWCWRCVWR